MRLELERERVCRVKLKKELSRKHSLCHEHVQLKGEDGDLIYVRYDSHKFILDEYLINAIKRRRSS